MTQDRAGDLGGDMGKDRFRDDAGPYLLGALDEADSIAFEAHLPGCPACRDEVAALRPVVTMLGALSPQDARLLLADTGTEPSTPSPPMPDTLLAGLLAQASRRTRRRHTALGALGAVAALAAAAVVALVVVLLGRPDGGAPVPAAAPAVVMQQVTPASAVTATATVTSRPWGTEITLHCRYRTTPAGTQYPTPGGPAVYTLQVTDTAGMTHDLGSWTLGSGQQAEFTGGTAVPRAQIRRIDVLASDGMPVLSAAG